ncbi:CopY/TcrY family copper transport repressor [Xylocopilactobacillus apis]|uniref:Transcriptional regulator n=1 Tax=Xylocopilactobacillus apis TaxID=2932183 RepID=A0AAU9CY56_9LACO|nr:transcriptional regulator [Xylocopilactobacillus apis]
MEEQVDISQAEWEIMRIIWTLGPTRTNTLVKILKDKMKWKDSTTKTLLARLTKKEFLTPTKEGREFCYASNITEDEAIDKAAKNLFSNICAMKVGSSLNRLIKNTPLSKSDISSLEQLLENKYQTAPETISCNCVPLEYQMDCCAVVKDESHEL